MLPTLDADAWSLSTISTRWNSYPSTGQQDKDKICWRCRQYGHIAVNCHVRLDHFMKAERALNLQTNFVMQQTTTSNSNTTPGLLESANEVTAAINGMNTMGLLDTGSTVSNISESFYNQHLTSSPLESLTCLLAPYRSGCQTNRPAAPLSWS